MQFYMELQMVVVLEPQLFALKWILPIINQPFFTQTWRWKPRAPPLTGLDFTSENIAVPFLPLPVEVIELVMTLLKGFNPRLWQHEVEEVGNLNEIVPYLYPGKQ